jgi:hypothetical protein
MTTIKDIEKLGYEVGEAFRVEADGAEVVVYRVDGFGLSMMVRNDDAEVLRSLADPGAQAEREQQEEETPDETRERWIAEGKLDAPAPG